MRTVEVTKATQPLATYAKRVKNHPVVVTIDGKPLAVLVGVQNADWETVSLSNNPRFIALIERSRSRLKREGGLTPKEMRKRLGLHKNQSTRRLIPPKAGLKDARLPARPSGEPAGRLTYDNF